jgi:hypothetical protein
MGWSKMSPSEKSLSEPDFGFQFELSQGAAISFKLKSYAYWLDCRPLACWTISGTICLLVAGRPRFETPIVDVQSTELQHHEVR